MTRSQALGLTAALIGGYLVASTFVAAYTPIKPRHEVAPRMDVFAPSPACDKIMQELNLKHGMDAVVSMDTFIAIRAKLRPCGGDIVPEDN